VDAKVDEALNAFRIVGPGGALLSRRSVAAPAPQPVLEATGPRTVKVQWDSRAFPAALVQDAETMAVLAQGQGGVIELETEARALEVTVSDGVKSQRFRLENQPQ
jgi:hypothetical protein